MVSVVPILCLALGALPQVDVVESSPCVDGSALSTALETALPAPWRSAEAPLRLTVAVSPGPDGQPATLAFSLTAPPSTAPIIQRKQPINEPDCPSLPQLIAVIIGRHLADLPREAWPELMAPSRPPPSTPMPGGPSPPLPPPLEHTSLRVNLHVALGVEAGLDGSLWGGLLRGDVTLGGASGFGLLLGVEALTFDPLTVGDGSARMTTVMARAGVVWEHPVGGPTLAISLGVGGGGHIAQGLGYDRDVLTVGAAVRAFAGVGVRTAWGLSATLGGAVSVVRARLSAPGAPGGIDVPMGRLGLLAGYVFGD